MHQRGINFGAGPATLPLEILQSVQEELLNWHETGMSILELGHRSEVFMQLLEEAEQDLRSLLHIPSSYHVLFIGGPARLQFASIPLNFLAKDEQAAYLVSGLWSSMALQEAEKVKSAYCLASSEKDAYTKVPAFSPDAVRKNTAYLYYTPNETINGTRFPFIPQQEGLPLVADMTSCILSEPIDVRQFGLIFAGAQKNIANAGLTIVIIQDALLARINGKELPTLLDYRTFVQHKSLYATPPTFNCYLAHKMFQWLKKEGGVESLYQKNCIKAERLYQYIDSTSFYHCAVEKASRSLMNVCFRTQSDDLDVRFVREAKNEGLLALKGHRFAKGLRASLYNAMPLVDVEKLIDFMSYFAENNQ